LELLPVGADWWMARTSRAAMTALQRSGVVFRRKWRPSKLHAWEGPFSDPTQRLPQHPRVTAERAAARKRWRARQRARDPVQPTAFHGGLPRTSLCRAMARRNNISSRGDRGRAG